MAARVPSARELLGRTIVAVEQRTFPDGRGGTAHDPKITLDDGSVLTFTVEETEQGDYGVFVIRTPARKRRAAGHCRECGGVMRGGECGEGCR